jgi:hypothetical protein
MNTQRRTALQKAIADHLSNHGPREWEGVQQQYPDIAQRTFWRYVKQAKESPPLPEHVAAARERVQHIEGALPDSVADRAPLPAPVPLSYLTQSGPKALRKIDLLQVIHASMADIEVLRKFSMTADGANVRIPKILVDSVRLRLTVSELFLSLVGELWSRERQQQFYDLVMDAIQEESPDCAKRITNRLKKLNGTV